MYALEKTINEPICTVIRHAYIKRRLLSTGLYETDWQNISNYIINWGTISSGVDDVRLNRFNMSGVNLICDNKNGEFNREDNANSLWFGYLSRYGTLLKITAGYYGTGGWGMPWGDAWGGATEESLQGIFILDQEIPITSDNKIQLNGSALNSIFDMVKPVEVKGLNATLTASEIITKIRDHTDGASLAIFQQYITSGAWNIQATTNPFTLATATSLQDYDTLWDLMTELSSAEGFVLYVDRSGGLQFCDRTANTTASQFSFYGKGFPKQNIIKINNYREALNKVYNNIRYKYLEDDTSTSYVTAATSTAISPTNVQWKYGSRTYELSNRLGTSIATAQTIADNMFTEFSAVKGELSLVGKFHPELEPLDRVDVNYYSYSLSDKSLWNVIFWDSDNWAVEGDNFDWENKQFKILSKSINLDDFSEQFNLREV